MSDAVMVPSLRDAAQAVVDRWETPLWKEVEPTAHVIARLRQALAASTPVGGWEEPVAWTSVAQIAALSGGGAGTMWATQHTRDSVALYAAPPPPSVSTGSRPQEAVPTEQAGQAVVGWQDIETAPRDGRWLLLEGEMSGGDTSTVRVGRWNPTYSDATRCTYEWQCVDPYAHGTEDEAVSPDGFWNWYSDGRICGWQPLPASDGGSSNEGAGGWIECPACDGSGKIVEAATTTGANQHSACQRDCEDCWGSGRILPQTEKGS